MPLEVSRTVWTTEPHSQTEILTQRTHSCVRQTVVVGPRKETVRPAPGNLDDTGRTCPNSIRVRAVCGACVIVILESLFR